MQQAQNGEQISIHSQVYQQKQTSMMITTNKTLFLLLLFVSISPWCLINKFDHQQNIYQTSFSPDGTLVAVGSDNRKHHIYQSPSNQIVYTYMANMRAYSVKFSPNQQYIAYGLENDSIIILNSTYHFVKEIRTEFGNIAQVCFSPDSNQIIVCGSSGEDGYAIYSVPAGNPLKEDYTYNDDARSCRFSSTGSYAVGSKDGYLRYYTASYNLAWFNRENSDSQIDALDFSPNGSYIVASSTDTGKRVAIWDVGSNTPVVTVSSGGSDVWALDWNNDSSVFAIGSQNENIYLYNGSSTGTFATQLEQFTEPGNEVQSLDFSFNSQWLVAATKSDDDILIYKRDCDPKPQNSQQFCPAEKYMDTANSCRMCARDMTGCRKCTNATVCLACSDQYYLDTGTNLCSLCSSILTACVLCADASTCEQCASEYFLSAGQCLDCFTAIDGCLVCNSSSYCFECAANSHYLNSSSGLCVSCPSGFANCLNCNSSQCLRCQPSYFLDSAECSKCSENCSVCTTASTTCTSCDIGFYLSGSSCLPCVPFCTLCSDATTCLSCQQGYFLSGSSCLACNFSCSRCVVSATNCLSCNSGFYLSGTSCLPCSGGCISCTSSSNCLSCGTGNFLSGTSCAHCSSVVSNCLICDGINCWDCAAGFTLANNTCNSCSSLQPGCQICEDSSCVLCLREYYLSSGNCLSCVYPCLTCYSSTQCLSCPVGYFLNATDACQVCPCPSCSSLTACLSCAVGEYLDTGSCYSCSAVHSHCLNCQSNIVCTDCAPPFFLSGNNCSRCTLGCSSCNGASCLTCEPGFYISGSSCLSCLNNCSVCTSAAVCTECVPGHYLSNSTCISCSSLFSGCTLCNSLTCLSCDEVNGYYLNTSLCSLCSQAISRCITCLSQFICLSCQPSYTVDIFNTSKCILCASSIPLCQICSNSTSCDLCMLASYPANNSCLPCSDGCSICTSQTNCLKCLDQFWLNGSTNCVECASVLMGCQQCSSLSTCIDCAFGYYLSTTICLPCSISISGCLSCLDSTSCQSCQSGYYLDLSLHCLTCESNLSGCAFCRSSLSCDLCKGGYYLSNSSCLMCSDPNCLNCDSSICFQCTSGYYLVNSTCSLCSTIYTGCIMCNSTQCLTCQTGFYLASGLCQQCSDANCQICSSTTSLCLSCNSRYYINAGACQPCQTTMAGCQQCLTSILCNECIQGYYMLANNTGCSLCSTSLSFCHICSDLSTCTLCDNGNFLVNGSCILCATYMQGCAYCQLSNICQSCLQGYYLNTNTSLCQRCGVMEGCLICRDGNQCRFCKAGYYLLNGTCFNCSTALAGCVVCNSSSACLICQGIYTLSGGQCQQIQLQASASYSQFKFTSAYIDGQTLVHTLWIKGDTFTKTNLNLSVLTKISYLSQRGVITYLIINKYEWGQNMKKIMFYTNNPFNLEIQGRGYNSMSLFSLRRMQYDHNRLVQTSNFELNVDFILQMAQGTVHAILSNPTHGGDLSMSYNIQSPEFIASTLYLKEHYYHFFGWGVVLFVAIFYFIKGVVLDAEGVDKGQMISHLLLLKTPALAVFPAYAELIDYCRGFMIGDLPFLYDTFGEVLSDGLDQTPDPYRVFYVSLSISSTYLLALTTIIALAIVIRIIAYISQDCRPPVHNCALFLYNFFYSGLAFASIIAIQGAFLNFSEEFTINSAFYLLGIVIFFVLIGQAVWSSCHNLENIFKIRVLFKVLILSLLHYNPLYLCSIVAGTQLFFILMQFNIQKILCPYYWLFSNILANLALLLLILLSHSLAVIYAASALIICVLTLESMILYEQTKKSNTLKKLRMETDGGSLCGLEQHLEVVKRKTDTDLGGTLALDTFAQSMLGHEQMIKVQPNHIVKEYSRDTFFKLQKSIH